MEAQLIPHESRFEPDKDRQYCPICMEPLELTLDFGHVCPNSEDEDHTDENLYL